MTGLLQSYLVGREQELAVAGEALESAAAGRLGIAVIDGEAGIGKSRLLDELVAQARARGFRVFTGRMEELEQSRPFAALMDALLDGDDLAAGVRARLAEVTGVGQHAAGSITSDPGLQFRAVDAIVELVEEEALCGPVVLALDDLHWADHSTLLTLRSLMRRLRAAPVALVLTLRPLPHNRGVRAFVEALRSEHAIFTPLTPLGDGAIRELAAHVLGAEPGPGLVRMLRSTSGNPLFTIELLDALVQDGSLARSGEIADVAELDLPPGLRLTIIRHISFLPDEAIEALRSAAILGAGFSMIDLAVTSGRTAHELTSALRAGLEARLLAENHDGGLKFRHELIREALYDDIPRSMRAALHLEAGRRLADTNAPALQVAEQLCRAGPAAAAETVLWLTEAARRMGQGAPHIAADLLGRALDLTPSGDGAWAELIAERGMHLFWCGRIREAMSAFRELLDRRPDSGLAVGVRACLGKALLAEGRIAEALAALTAGEQVGGLAEADRTANRAWAAHARVLLGDLDGATATAASTRAAAADAGDEFTASIATCCLAMVRGMQGRFTEGERHAREALRLAERSPGSAGHRFPVGVFLGRILLETDRLDEAVVVLRCGRRRSEEIGARWNLPYYQSGLITGHYLAGDWDDAVAEYETAVDLADESGVRHGMDHNFSIRALIALHRGDVAAAAALLACADREFAATGLQSRVDRTHWARALLQQAEGRVAEAFACISRAWASCVAAGFSSELPAIGPDYVRLAVAVGEQKKAEAAAAAVAEVAAGEQPAWVQAAALQCAGELARDPSLLLAAVEAAKASRRPLLRAATLEHAAGLLRQQPAQSTSCLLEALALYEGLDAVGDVLRVEAALRNLGVRRGQRPGRGRPSTGWASLTETERRVVELVREGLSNPRIGERLFVSPRTVQTHLAHVFVKLGVSSRAQLASLATQHCAASGFFGRPPKSSTPMTGRL